MEHLGIQEGSKAHGLLHCSPETSPTEWSPTGPSQGSTWTHHLLLHNYQHHPPSPIQRLGFWLELPSSSRGLPSPRAQAPSVVPWTPQVAQALNPKMIFFLVLAQTKVLPLRWIFPHPSPPGPDQTLKGIINDFSLGRIVRPSSHHSSPFWGSTFSPRSPGVHVLEEGGECTGQFNADNSVTKKLHV